MNWPLFKSCVHRSPDYLISLEAEGQRQTLHPVDVPHPLFVVLKISSPTFLPCWTTRFLQFMPQLQNLLHSNMWFLPTMKESLRQAMLFLAMEYGKAFLPSEFTNSSIHEQDRYSQPMFRPLSFRHWQPVINSSPASWTDPLSTCSLMN